MPQININGWQRIGIVLSVFWCLLIVVFAIEVRINADARDVLSINNCSYKVEPFYDWYDEKSGLTIEMRAIQLTPQAPKHPGEPPRPFIGCDDIQTTISENTISSNIVPVLHTRYAVVAVFILVPIALFWILAYLLIYTVKWVIKGFHTSKD